MAQRAKDRLSALAVSRTKQPGAYPDGLGLYLLVGPNGAKSWIYRYATLPHSQVQRRNDAEGRPLKPARNRDMGLGPYPAVSLQDARRAAMEGRRLRSQGIDPLDARGAQRAALAAETAAALSFEEASRAYVAAHRAGWRSGKHSDQWINTLVAYAFPTAGALLVQHVDTAVVTKILEPIWTKKPATARRLRGRIEAVLDWATARGHRRGENPARWRGHLDKLLSKPKRTVQHHPSLPYDELPSFMADLAKEEGDAAAALKLVISTVTRTTEAIAAKVGEVDFDKALWIIPAERTKPHREFRIPLTGAALEILRPFCEGKKTGDWIFPGRNKSHLSNGAMLMLLERMQRGNLTVHGFRATFRTWAAERTNFPREVAEMCLGHVVSDATEAAYQRSDMIERRRQLLDAWARFAMAMPKRGDVVSINRKGRTTA